MAYTRKNSMAQARKKRPKKTPQHPAPDPSRGGRVAVRLTDTRKALAEVPGPAEHLPRPRGRGVDVRERILKVALEYFGTFGFEGTSTRAVAERAGVGHTLVLYHFQSKEKLLIATVEAALKGYADALAANIATAPDRSARDALTTFIEQFVRMSARHPHIHRLMTMNSNQETKRLEWVIEHFIRGHFTFVRDLIRRGQAEGSVRECDPARLYYLIIGARRAPLTLPTAYKRLTCPGASS